MTKPRGTRDAIGIGDLDASMSLHRSVENPLYNPQTFALMSISVARGAQALRVDDATQYAPALTPSYAVRLRKGRPSAEQPSTLFTSTLHVPWPCPVRHLQRSTGLDVLSHYRDKGRGAVGYCPWCCLRMALVDGVLC